MNSKTFKDFFTKNLVIIPLFAALVLRLYKITASSIWHDEGYTMWLIRYNWGEILERTARDVHPPFYYFVAKAWTTIAGNSVFSIRFLSLLFSVAIVYLVYLIIKEIWSERAAFWAAMFTAFSPFMVRFGQEARMYGVVAFFTTLATFFLVKYIKEKDKKWLPFYAASMILGMYTQYYAFFVVISHWVILSLFTPGFWSLRWKESIKQIGVFDGWWWLANISLLLLYTPWFPVAYAQVTRVSGSYWIKPEWITMRTIPNNVLQFATYTHFDKVYSWKYFGPVIYWLVSAGLTLGGVFLLKDSKQRKVAGSVLIFGLLPMALVYALSELKTPVYQDRYFPFSAVALFAIWGMLVAKIKNRWIEYIVGVIGLLVLLTGNYIMHVDVNHQMAEVKSIISTKEVNDAVVSGELYTFLDSSYYLGYGNIKFASEPVDGYGESSLFYDQQQKYLVNLKELQTENNRIWVIGKTGEKDYFAANNWVGWSQSVYLNENKANGLKVVLFEKAQ